MGDEGDGAGTRELSDLRLEAKLCRIAIEHMAQGLLMLDGDLRITVVNQTFLTLYGLSAEVVCPGASAYDLVAASVHVGNYGDATVEAAWAAASARLRASTAWRIQQRLRSGRIVDISYEPMPDGGWVTTHLDVTERQLAEDRLMHLAHHDPLTGLANRTLLLDTLTRQLQAEMRLAVLLIDLDRFKPVNDQLGHACGDELLRQVGQRIRQAVPDQAMTARIGGDEFVVTFALDASSARASRVAAAVKAAVGRPFQLGADTAQIGASIGIAQAPECGTRPELLLRCADIALYEAKSGGRNRSRAYGRRTPRRGLGVEEGVVRR